MNKVPALVALLIAMASVLAAKAQAQEASTAKSTVGEPADGDAESDRSTTSDIVVTGSLIRGLPKEYLASPVFTSTQADIVHSGASSASEYALTIPQNFTGDLSEFATTGAGIGSPLGNATPYNQFDGFSSFALRGLGSDATLTLLNGRRMASAGMTEASTISVIPSMLIERIDIIPDGASATYGADAVAGVVNIVTRKPDHGLELQVRGATATETGKTDYQASALAGHSWGSGSIYGMAMYQKRAPYLTDPVDADGYLFQTSQLPRERLSGFYAGGQQEVGALTFSVDASRFERDRGAVQNFPDYPKYSRTFDSRTIGYSANGAVHWQGAGSTSVDLNLDYGRNRNRSDTATGGGAPFVRREKNTLFVAELRGQTALATLPGGPILAAAAAQYRVETLDTDALAFFGRGGGTRRARSVFGEIDAPLVGPDQGIPGVRSLTISAAARYENLGFDDALSPKFGARWQIDRSIALRGTYARSFLTPRFRNTIGITEQVSFGVYDYKFLNPADQRPDLPTGSALVMFRAGANPDLKTQKADTLTAGVDLTPTFIPNLAIKAGYYRIKISDRIGTPSPDDALSVPDLQAFAINRPTLSQVQAVLFNPAVAQSFAEVPSINDGELIIFPDPRQVPADLLGQVQAIVDIRAQNFAVESTDGLDLELTYRTRIAGGTANVHLSGQYILNLDLKAGGATAISRLGGFAKPSDLRLNGTLSWSRGALGLGTVVNYVDGFTDDRAGHTSAAIGAYTTASLFLGMDLHKLWQTPWLRGSEAQIVVANVLDQQPGRVVDGTVGYDPYNNPPMPRTIGLVLTKRL